MLRTLTTSFRLLDGTRPTRWAVLIVMAIAVSGLEAIGAVLISGLMALIAAPATADSVPILGLLERVFPDADRRDLMISAIVLMAIFFVLRALAQAAQSYLQNRVAQAAGVRLSMRLMAGYLRSPYELHVQRNSSDLIRNTLSSVTEVLGSSVIPAIGLGSDALMIAAIGLVLVMTAPIPTLLTVVLLGPTVYGIIRFLQPRLRAAGEASLTTYTSALQHLRQSLEGLREIKLLGREDFFEGGFEVGRRAYARSQYRRAVMLEVPRIALETILVLFLLGFLLLTIVRGEPTDDIVAVLGVFAYAALRVLPSVNRIVANLNAIRYSTAAVESLSLDIALIDQARQASTDTGAAIELEHAIELDDVAYRYPGTEHDALFGVSLRIVKGESHGIVGATGAGKSTLLDLLVGLIPPTRGQILVDGIDIAGATAGWQANIGLVPQSLFLIDDTLESNIALGAEPADLDRHRLAEAVRIAQLDQFVGTLPRGLETIVGERGVRLSGGQRQRIAIARALYRDPPVLVFDEGTSALDMMTEAQLVEELRLLHRDRTMVIVAHRLATVKECDRIHVIDEGRLIASGTYDQLLVDSPIFRRLAGSAADRSNGGT